MLLETSSCLAYTQEDLPPDLSGLGLSYHVHLPVDLPWEQGADVVFSAIEALRRKIAFVRPWGYVLHPPSPSELAVLLEKDSLPRQTLLLENIRENDLIRMWPVVREHDLGVCLDIGHLVSYEQRGTLDLPGLFERVRMLHVYGGESGAGHAELARFPDPGLLREILTAVRPDAVLVVEVFRMDAFTRSLALLRQWMNQWGMACDYAGFRRE